jgi:hypothetical protein
MSNYALRIPNSLMQAAKRVAERDSTSMNHLFVVAIAEKLSALETVEHFERRAARGDRSKLRSILGKLPKDRQPDAGDELPTDLRHRNAARRKPSAR